jgi:hypothetical protein
MNIPCGLSIDVVGSFVAVVKLVFVSNTSFSVVDVVDSKMFVKMKDQC